MKNNVDINLTFFLPNVRCQRIFLKYELVDIPYNFYFYTLIYL